jgi:hypothetical protein
MALAVRKNAVSGKGSLPADFRHVLRLRPAEIVEKS